VNSAKSIVDFPKNEYVSRWENVQAAMERQNIDALLIGKEENVTYFSGFRRVLDYQFVYMILPRTSAPILIAPLDQRGNVEAMSWIEDVRYFGPHALGFLSASEVGTKVLAEIGLNEKTVGLESSPRVPQQDVWDALKAKFRSTVRADSIFEKLRRVKSPRELQYIRRACDINAKAITKGLAAIREGMSERDYARIVYRTAIDEGAVDTPLKGALNLLGGSNRYAMIDTRPTDYTFHKKDIVILDSCIAYRGYYCDMTRLTCIGQPSKQQRKMYDVALEAQLAGIDAYQPGQTVAEVCHSVERVFKKHNMTQYKLPVFGTSWFGHSVGLEIHERPDIVPVAPDADVVLEPGMVLTMEPCLCDAPVIMNMLHGSKLKGEGVFFVEDNILITKSGHEVLTAIPRELNIV
jgi:Xaa-Pro aminopeptidase